MIFLAHQIRARFGSPALVLLAGIILMALLFIEHIVFAQGFTVATQDGINAMLLTRQDAISGRLDKLETLLTGVIIGVFTNLVALFFALLKGKIGAVR